MGLEIHAKSMFLVKDQYSFCNPDEESYDDLMATAAIMRLLPNISDQSDFLSLLLARGQLNILEVSAEGLDYVCSLFSKL